MSEIIYLRNKIRGLRDRRDEYLNLADETSDVIVQTQLKLAAIEQADKIIADKSVDS